MDVQREVLFVGPLPKACVCAAKQHWCSTCLGLIGCDPPSGLFSSLGLVWVCSVRLPASKAPLAPPPTPYVLLAEVLELDLTCATCCEPRRSATSSARHTSGAHSRAALVHHCGTPRRFDRSVWLSSPLKPTTGCADGGNHPAPRHNKKYQSHGSPPCLSNDLKRSSAASSS